MGSTRATFAKPRGAYLAGSDVGVGGEVAGEGMPARLRKRPLTQLRFPAARLQRLLLSASRR